MSKKSELLSRDAFRNSVFERDGFACIVCGAKAVDAHHIIERRLFSDGGYYVDNGVSLCEKHHIEAETTVLPCEELRKLAGITKVVIPEHMYDDNEYDKWGNIILPNGERLKGELFYDESVQKILSEGGVLDKFSKYVKYPRTYHLPWSTLGKDDRMLKDDSIFEGKEVVVTLKMDGENTTMYDDRIHARSLDSLTHESRDWVKGLWGRIKYSIPENMRICGENLFAKHTIAYDSLPTFFMVFSIWERSTCLSWDETVEYARMLGLETVPVMFRGTYDRNAIVSEFGKYPEHEGYVIRLADSFEYGNFRKSIAKFVRPEFKQAVNESHGHWIRKAIEKNSLKKVPNNL